MQLFRTYYRAGRKHSHIVDHTPDLSRITVDTQIFDDFVRNAYITIQFEEKGDEIYLYKMLKENNDGILMELIPEN